MEIIVGAAAQAVTGTGGVAAGAAAGTGGVVAAAVLAGTVQGMAAAAAAAVTVMAVHGGVTAGAGVRMDTTAAACRRQHTTLPLGTLGPVIAIARTILQCDLQ